VRKHAYLIMAHNEFGILKKQLLLLDHIRNDIYVHIDKKVRAFDFSQFTQLVKKSKLFFVQRTAVTWAAYSQINAELMLLKEAVMNNYEYYHLLSGSDLPLKSQDEIHDFFDQHSGLEFLEFDLRAYTTKDFYERIQYYHFFQELMGKKRQGMLNFMNNSSLKGQQILGINRIRNSKFDFNKGLNWFSITHALAHYVLSQENMIRNIFRYTLAADEVVIHTIVWNSDFKNRISDKIIRYTKKGRPYIFRDGDFERLMRLDAFWVRKFSENVDPIIVEKIFNFVMNQ
jgi:hypothetical protein